MSWQQACSDGWQSISIPSLQAWAYSFPLLYLEVHSLAVIRAVVAADRWWKTLGLYKRCSCGNVLTKSGVPQWSKAFFRRLAIAQTEQRLLTRQNDLFLCSSWVVKSLGSLVEQCIGGEILQCYSLSKAMEPGGRVTSKKCVHEQNILHAGRTSEAWSFYALDSTFLGHLLGSGLKKQIVRIHLGMLTKQNKQVCIITHKHCRWAPVLQTVWRSGRLVDLPPCGIDTCAMNNGSRTSCREFFPFDFLVQTFSSLALQCKKILVNSVILFP